jgi:hypothetical protein
MNFDIFYGDTFIPELPKMLNKNFATIQKGMDIFYDASQGILLKPLITTGKVQGANGQFVTMVVDNLVVKNQFTNLFDNNTTADYNFYKTYITVPFIPRDACTAATNWPFEPSTFKYIDVNQPYYKITNENPIFLQNNNLSQIVGIIFPYIDPCVYGTQPFKIMMDPNLETTFQLDSSMADASTYFYMEFICTAYDASYGPSWSQYKYGTTTTGGSGGSGGGGYVGPGTINHIPVFNTANSILDTSISVSGSTLLTYDINADGSIMQLGHEVTRFLPSTDSSVTVGVTIGGIPAGTPAGDLKGKTYEELLDLMLFPTIPPSVSAYSSFTLSQITPAGSVEVGTPYTPTINAAFFPGTIRNGNNSAGPSLVGDASTFYFMIPGGGLDATVSATGNVQAHTYPIYNIQFGANTWSASVDYIVGTGIYRDNKNVPSNILDGSRIAGTKTTLTNTISGARFAWRGYGNLASVPANSAAVRALTSKSLLSGTNTGAFSILIPAGTPYVYFFVPAGKLVNVKYAESSFADVTGSFTNTGILVKDAGGVVDQNYEKWVSYIGVTGYPSTATYNITLI